MGRIFRRAFARVSGEWRLQRIRALFKFVVPLSLNLRHGWDGRLAARTFRKCRVHGKAYEQRCKGCRDSC
jgi:hypothetical protein